MERTEFLLQNFARVLENSSTFIRSARFCVWTAGIQMAFFTLNFDYNFLKNANLI